MNALVSSVSPLDTEDSVAVVGQLTFSHNPADRDIQMNGTPLHLDGAEYRLLRNLLYGTTHFVPYGQGVTNGAQRNLICSLRKKLNAVQPGSDAIIIAVPACGYRVVGLQRSEEAIRYRCEFPGYVILLYEDWTATINGREIVLHRPEYILMAALSKVPDTRVSIDDVIVLCRELGLDLDADSFRDLRWRFRRALDAALPGSGALLRIDGAYKYYRFGPIAA